MHLEPAVVSPEDASFPTSGQAAEPSSPPRDESCIQPTSTAPWRPRAGAGHLAKGPAGIWHTRLAIPERIRRLNPGLPRELKRSTLVTQKRLALACARKMCSELVASLKLPESEEMLASGSTHQSRFTIEFIDGRIQTAFAPDPADADAIILFSRIQGLVMAQMAARATRGANASPPAFPSSADLLISMAPAPSVAMAQIPPSVPSPVVVETITAEPAMPGAPV